MRFARKFAAAFWLVGLARPCAAGPEASGPCGPSLSSPAVSFKAQISGTWGRFWGTGGPCPAPAVASSNRKPLTGPGSRAASARGAPWGVRTVPSGSELRERAGLHKDRQTLCPSWPLVPVAPLPALAIAVMVRDPGTPSELSASHHLSARLVPSTGQSVHVLPRIHSAEERQRVTGSPQSRGPVLSQPGLLAAPGSERPLLPELGN